MTAGSVGGSSQYEAIAIWSSYHALVYDIKTKEGIDVYSANAGTQTIHALDDTVYSIYMNYPATYLTATIPIKVSEIIGTTAVLTHTEQTLLANQQLIFNGSYCQACFICKVQE